MVIAIDGPAGAGKSTVARLLSERLGFLYLDTGAMYRALTWLALDLSADLDDGAELARLAAEQPVTFAGGRVRIAGNDVSARIRESRVDAAVSTVARHPEVRDVMRERQRELALLGDAVVEGRDIGAVVFPGAEVKVYLVADPDERARRRGVEQPGTTADELWRRDELDAMQMRPAEDAFELDTTQLTIDEVVACIEQLVRARSVA